MIPRLVVGMIPLRVVGMIPLRVPEMVPDLVPEIVPVLANVGTEIVSTNIVARRIGLALFIVLLLVKLNVRGLGLLKVLPPSYSLGRP
jgi:hypothetical protein